MQEAWRDIEGYGGFYQISNLGRVKSRGKQCAVSEKRDIIRATSLTHDGYVKVRLLHRGMDKTARVHRLVAEAFLPNPENKPTVNHIDGNKQNNAADNLEWADRTEQMAHAYALGLKAPLCGSAQPNAKLTDEQVRDIRDLYVPYDKCRGTVALSKKYGVSNRVIGLIVRGMSYQNVK